MQKLCQLLPASPQCSKGKNPTVHIGCPLTRALLLLGATLLGCIVPPRPPLLSMWEVEELEEGKARGEDAKKRTLSLVGTDNGTRGSKGQLIYNGFQHRTY